ncbi:MAG: ribosome rescue protein RqcH [Candidatus Heimdallarchaeaceae archaeon]
MKTSLTSLDINCLVEELRPEIIGSWLNNIYSIGEKLLILKFRKSSKNNFELVIEPGKRFHITKYVRDKPTTPTNKVSMIRKHIRDLPVDNFYQVAMDRIIVFEIAYKNSHYKLIVELFGEGNYILVSPENKILVARRYRRMRDRDIHPGKEFYLPPQMKDNIATITKEKIEEELTNATGKIVPLLNNLLGLGPKYSKDIILKANINKNELSELTEEEKKALVNEILKIQEIVVKKNFDPHQYLDGEEVIDITPIPILWYSDLESKKVESFNQAIDDFFSANEEEPEYTEDKHEVKGKLTKYEKILRDQIKHKEKLEEQEQIEKKKADLLYTHFAVVDELLQTIVNARKANISWEEIKKKLALGKKQHIPAAEILKDIDPKQKKIWVTLTDVETGYTDTIELDFTLSVAESANMFYEKSKKARRKIPGAIIAIERTKKLVEEAKEKGEELKTKEETKKMVLKRPKRWYEKFHWFKCDDYIVIGGTDAKTNEHLLKTYLEDNDLFFHADVHGAPYVVVKDGLNKVSEECIKEVANFALTYSSLWKDNKLVGDVYYVSPEQVSFAAPSGQFLAKGSVMIYGEKNYIKNVEINHSLGLLLFKDYAQVIGGPTNRILKKTDFIVSIKPGDVPKGTIAKKIKQLFLDMCPEEERYKVEALDVNEIMKFIPGNAEIID